jgi:hypothetical protein
MRILAARSGGKIRERRIGAIASRTSHDRCLFRLSTEIEPESNIDLIIEAHFIAGQTANTPSRVVEFR